MNRSPPAVFEFSHNKKKHKRKLQEMNIMGFLIMRMFVVSNVFVLLSCPGPYHATYYVHLLQSTALAHGQTHHVM